VKNICAVESLRLSREPTTKHEHSIEAVITLKRICVQSEQKECEKVTKCAKDEKVQKMPSPTLEGWSDYSIAQSMDEQTIKTEMTHKGYRTTLCDSRLPQCNSIGYNCFAEHRQDNHQQMAKEAIGSRTTKAVHRQNYEDSRPA
jgi:hypothetical protein